MRRRGNRADRLYELFINRLRHPYARYPMLIVSVINPHEKEQGFDPRRIGGSGNPPLNPRDARGELIGDPMYTSASLDKSVQSRVNPLSSLSGAIGQAQLVGAVIGLAGGVFTAMSGAVVTAASWFVANEVVRQWLLTAGTVLFLLTIPLIIFGGFCMDWVEKNKPRRGFKLTRYEDDDDNQ
jgi:hypothetical protein